MTTPVSRGMEAGVAGRACPTTERGESPRQEGFRVGPGGNMFRLRQRSQGDPTRVRRGRPHLRQLPPLSACLQRRDCRWQTVQTCQLLTGAGRRRVVPRVHPRPSGRTRPDHPGRGTPLVTAGRHRPLRLRLPGRRRRPCRCVRVPAVSRRRRVFHRLGLLSLVASTDNAVTPPLVDAAPSPASRGPAGHAFVGPRRSDDRDREHPRDAQRDSSLCVPARLPGHLRDARDRRPTAGPPRCAATPTIRSPAAACA